LGVIKFIAFSFGIIFLVVFCAFNRQIVAIDLFPFPYSAEITLFFFALICMAIGVILGGFSVSYQLMQTKYQLKKSSQQIAALENEIKSLRIEKKNPLPVISVKP
jgi:uncharacterized integral membrane protein